MATITATVTSDTYVEKDNPTTNRDTDIAIRLDTGDGTDAQTNRMMFKITMPSDPGNATITDITLNVYHGSVIDDRTVQSVDAHEITTAYVDSEVTWNEYSSGNNWTTGGGDYNATIIDSIDYPSSSPAWMQLALQGSEADNPLSLDWDDVVYILLKCKDETSGDRSQMYGHSKENTSNNKPYIEVTYTIPEEDLDVSKSTSLANWKQGVKIY